jgi:hypothetical protein
MPKERGKNGSSAGFLDAATRASLFAAFRGARDRLTGCAATDATSSANKTVAS